MVLSFTHRHGHTNTKLSNKTRQTPSAESIRYEQAPTESRERFAAKRDETIKYPQTHKQTQITSAEEATDGCIGFCQARLTNVLYILVSANPKYLMLEYEWIWPRQGGHLPSSAATSSPIAAPEEEVTAQAAENER
jgi:hypothetical protein